MAPCCSNCNLQLKIVLIVRRFKCTGTAAANDDYFDDENIDVYDDLMDDDAYNDIASSRRVLDEGMFDFNDCFSQLYVV